MSLLLALFLCHFLADYTWLSRPYMLAAKRFGRPIKPILDHGCVHGLLMLWTMYAFGIRGWEGAGLACFQVVAHTAIDVLKGRLNARYVALQSPANVAHWIVFGLDQYAHTVVILLMWYATLPK